MPGTWIAVLTLTAAAASPQQEHESKVATAVPPVAGRAVSESGGTSERPVEVATSREALRKRTGRELLAAVREALPRLARPDDDELEATIEELLFTLQELREDDDMAISHREYYSAKVEHRLQELSLQLQKRIARNKRLSKPQPPAEIRDDVGAAHLAQRAAGAPGAARPLIGGSPARPPGRMQPNDDYGQHLVDLIQKTVAPSSWDINGGLGSIYYWRPGRALVVRQTGEVHDQMGGALDQLRRAGP